MNYFVMGDALMFPVIPEIMLAIPLNNSPSDKKTIVKNNPNPGHAKSITAKITTIIPKTIFAITLEIKSPNSSSENLINSTLFSFFCYL